MKNKIGIIVGVTSVLMLLVLLSQSVMAAPVGNDLLCPSDATASVSADLAVKLAMNKLDVEKILGMYPTLKNSIVGKPVLCVNSNGTPSVYKVPLEENGLTVGMIYISAKKFGPPIIGMDVFLEPSDELVKSEVFDIGLPVEKLNEFTSGVYKTNITTYSKADLNSKAMSMWNISILNVESKDATTLSVSTATWNYKRLSVPHQWWSHGCTPTAITMILKYHGAGCVLEQEVANAIGTDAKGNTNVINFITGRVTSGTEQVAANHGITVDSWTVWITLPTGLYWDYVTEIDNSRPSGIHNLIGWSGATSQHSVAGEGYKYSGLVDWYYIVDDPNFDYPREWSYWTCMEACHTNTKLLSAIQLEIAIKNPTQASPAFAGIHDNPNRITIEIENKRDGKLLPCYDDSYPSNNRDAYSVKIGGKSAPFIIVTSVTPGKYSLDVLPPEQDSDGLYDLEITFLDEASDTEQDAVRYGASEFTPLDLCMVLDRSGSMRDPMGGKTKIQGVKEAAIGVVNVLLPQDRVSIISFSTTATTDIYLTSDFNAVKTKINQLGADGYTSFGAGLKLALDQLNTHENPDHIPAILFMSDGHHNTAPAPDAFVTECKNKGIPIFTVGFASSESQVDVARLKRMSDETGGEYRFVGEIFDLQNIFLKLQHKASGWESIATYVGEVNQGETVTAGSFYVDPAINNLRVTLNWPGSNLDLKLFNPNGRQVDFGAPNVIYSGDTKPEYVIIKDPQSGTWTVKVYGKTIGSSEKYYALVTKYVPPKPQICKVQITSDPSLQDRPSIVYANGYYYVAYQSWETSYSGLEHGWDIFIKKFDSNWNELAKVQVTSNRAYKDSPSLLFANNKLYVAYVSNVKGANVNDYDVIVKEYDPCSLSCTRGEKYLTTLQSRQDLPALYYKDGYFYLAYRSWERGSSYNGDICIKKFDSNWNQLKKVQVTSKGSLQARPSLTYANGYLYVAYYSMETGDRDIFVKRLDSNLNLDGFKKQITSEASEQSFPSISFVNNQFTIVYGSTETGTLGIFMKKYDSNWNFIEKTKVVDDNSAHERRPSMTYAQNDYWIAYVHNLVGSDDWNIFAIIPGCEEGGPSPTPTPTPKLRWEITVDKAEYSPGDYVHLTQQFTNEGEETVLITNPITTTFIAEDGSIVLEEDLSYSISVTLGAGGQWSFGTSYKLPDDAPEGYYDVKVSISGGNYVKTAEDLFRVNYPV